MREVKLLNKKIFTKFNAIKSCILRILELPKQNLSINNSTLNELYAQKKLLIDFKRALDETTNVSITNEEGTITYVNDKFCEITKYTKEEIIGKNHRILNSGYHKAEFFAGMYRVITSGKIWRGILKNKAKDGSHHWVKTTIIPFLDENGSPKQYMAVRTDITPLKKMEEKLANAFVELKKSEKLKDEFATMVSHELKTPLTPIQFHCEMLLEQGILGTLNQNQQNSVLEIVQNSNRLEKLISDMLDTQKLDMDKLVFNEERFNVPKFFKRIEESIRPFVKEKNVKLVIKNTVTTDITSDESRLLQVTSNLIKNAIDFVHEKSGKIEIGASIRYGDIIFYVKDNGIGIAKEKQQNIFKKFYQADTSMTRKHGGTGLGLVICKGIIDGLHGRIWFESEQNKGTTFFFSIPIRNEEIQINSSIK